MTLPENQRRAQPRRHAGAGAGRSGPLRLEGKVRPPPVTGPDRGSTPRAGTTVHNGSRNERKHMTTSKYKMGEPIRACYVKPGTAINLADALVAPDVLRPHLANWSEVVRYFVRSVEADVM